MKLLNVKPHATACCSVKGGEEIMFTEFSIFSVTFWERLCALFAGIVVFSLALVVSLCIAQYIIRKFDQKAL